MKSPAPALDSIQQRQAAKFYPEDDGLPMSNNTEQFDWIVNFKGNLDIWAADQPNVFVAGDLLWYPVEGSNQIRLAPDVMVAIGRPKGKRGSYMQWVEDNIPPQVVFEILSPGNRKQEMADKFAFFQRHGVEEYYLYDPAHGRLKGWLRNEQGVLAPIPDMYNWRSPRLQIRFVLQGLELQVYNPDGSRFLSFLEMNERLEEVEKRAFEALWEIDEAEARADQSETRAKQAEKQAQTETVARLEAEKQAQVEAVARLEAEKQAQVEAVARLEAEKQAQAETAARIEAEAKLKALEERLRAAGLG